MLLVRLITGAVFGSLVLLAVASPGRAVTIPVTSTADDGPPCTDDGSPCTSLRQALAVASDGDTIDATGISGTIMLTSGELVVTKNLSILGPGPAMLAVNGNANSRVFRITAGTLVHVPVPVVSISGVMITNGFASGPFPTNQGGGIWNDHAALTLSDCVVTGNSAAGNGGGIMNDAFDHGDATLEVDNCTISNNSALCCTFSNNTTTCPGSSPSCYSGGGIMNFGGPTGCSNAVPCPPGDEGATLTVTNSIISGNSAGYEGGAIRSSATGLTVSNSTLNDNTAGVDGGGISNSTNPLTVSNSTMSGNSTSGSGGGGGLYADGSATMTIDGSGTITVANSTISDNSSRVSGGGIQTLSGISLTVSNSTISGNSFSQSDQGGGGIASAGDAVVINSTISGNSGPNVGGGIVNFSRSLTVKDCTFSGNSAGGNFGNGGGAIFNWTGGTTQIGDTVLDVGATGAGGTLVNNSGAITSLGYNLSSDASGGDSSTGPGGLLNATGDMRNTDPKLGPLQGNGGLTFTHALCTASGVPDASCTDASAAIDAGDPAFDPNSFNPPLSDDQRGSGFPRVVNGRIDIGAFEVQGSGTTTTTSSTTTTNASSTTTTTEAPTTTSTTTTTTEASTTTTSSTTVPTTTVTTTTVATTSTSTSSTTTTSTSSSSTTTQPTTTTTSTTTSTTRHQHTNHTTTTGQRHTTTTGNTTTTHLTTTTRATTTSTRPTTTTTTSSTTTTLRPCGGTAPACSGACPSGKSCKVAQAGGSSQMFCECL